MPDLFKPSLIIEDIPQLLEYLPITLAIAGVSILFAWVIGFLVAVIKIYKVPILYQIAMFYVSFTRGTPVLVQLYLSYYGIPIILQYINYYTGANLNIFGLPNVVFVLVAFVCAVIEMTAQGKLLTSRNVRYFEKKLKRSDQGVAANA